MEIKSDRLRRRAALLGFALRQRIGVLTIGVIGGVLALLMVAAAGCDDSEPEIAREPTVTSQGPTTTATRTPPTLTPTYVPTVTPPRAPTSESPSSSAATQDLVPTATHVPTARPTQTATPASQPTQTPSSSPTATPAPTARDGNRYKAVTAHCALRTA